MIWIIIAITSKVEISYYNYYEIKYYIITNSKCNRPTNFIIIDILAGIYLLTQSLIY